MQRSSLNSMPRQLFCSGQFELKDELHQDDLKENNEFILLFKIVLGKELNKFFPPNRSDNLCLFFCIYPSSMFPHLQRNVFILFNHTAHNTVLFNKQITMHRKRIKTEEKAKVVLLLGGRNLFKSLPRYSCFALDDLNYSIG